ncbi:phosphopantetheine-binding protein [Rhizobium sp. EC-SD404]|uniref:acyl carrier protein n=1 Tax=Rhizobium sp. EC-SD404 TaxID=2038389 RepID=UPI001257B355|nr:phosphopantetheine-binding protein [Rhizobium sp. EC-SD404]VVT24096.1 Nodulation protein NodF [Rhizobium sp. EC-SD404]
MTTDTLKDEIIRHIAEYSDANADDITGSSMVDDLGIHSLELAELVMELEEKYDIEIETDSVESWNSLKTVDDIVAAVRAMLAAKAM